MSTRLLGKGSLGSQDLTDCAGVAHREGPRADLRPRATPSGSIAGSGWRRERPAMTGGWLASRDVGSDDEFIRALYDQHGGAVLAFALKRMADRGAAEDVLQETLVRAWRHREKLVNGAGSVRAWLFTVADRLIKDWARGRAARPREVLGFAAAADGVVRDHADRVINSAQVYEAVHKLSPEHREVVIHVYFHHRGLRETAVALGVAEGTVKSRLHYAMQALRKLLEVTM
jgi:RNA polymerase sigma-70 factor (ECF subfamily)